MLHPKEKERIQRLRLNGDSYAMISKIMKILYKDVKSYCEKDGLDFKIRTPKPKAKPKVGKYDHLFEEKLNEGKSYNEYRKSNKRW